MLAKSWCRLIFLCLNVFCFAQTKDTSYGTIITKTERGVTTSSTVKFLYIRNIAGDRLAAYTVADGVVSAATAYQLTGSGNGLQLYSHALLNDQQPNDSLQVKFQDKAHTVIVNKHDRYLLFPAFYTSFKAEVAGRHSIISLLDLLSDGLGDYSISAALPLVNFRPALTRRIQQATIVTQRSQADMQDTWTCRYVYNQQKLVSVIARSAEETRFIKAIFYQPNKSVRVDTYLNIESRQSSKRSALYGANERSPLKWRERYLEIGKNRETRTDVTLNWHDLGMLRKTDPSTAEVLQLLKPAALHKNAKYHID